MRPLAEHLLATHHGGDTEATVIGWVISGHMPIRHREAAGLLYLMRPDNFWNVRSGILRKWQQWTGPRLLHILPQMVLSCRDEAVARAAARALAEVAGLTVPGEGEWTTARQAAAYRAWRDLPAEQRPALPPLIAADWDRVDPVVAALQRESEALTQVDYARVLSNVGGPAKPRQAALRALIFEGADATWQVVLSHVERETDWSVIGYALGLSDACLPERVETLRAALVQRLRSEGEEGVRQLVLGLTEAQDREEVSAMAKLGAEVDRGRLCRIFQDIAFAQTQPLNWQMRSFAALRNTITAYGEIDRDGAVAFYQSLLQSARPRVREVGVYGCGDLHVAEAVPELLAALVPENENCMVASSVCVALGKIGSPEAYEALIAMLGRTDMDDRRRHAVATVMTSICGSPGRSPDGTWANGTWYTVTPDRDEVGPKFAKALRQAADQATDERGARMLGGRANMIMRAPAE